MVVGKPYVHFKINNEPLEVEPDYTYTWATTVETTKGPVNKPTLISSAQQAQTIFGVDMRPYFAQGADSLIMVRVAAESAKNRPSKGTFAFKTKEDIVVYRAQQAQITEVDTTQGANAVTYIHDLYYVKENDGKLTLLIQHRNSDGILQPDSYVSAWTKDGKILTKELAEASQSTSTPTSSGTEDGDGEGSSTSTTTSTTTELVEGVDYAKIYTSADGVKEFLTPVLYVIPKGTALFSITSQYEGDYGINVSIKDSDSGTLENTYDIILTDPSLGTIRINHAYDVSKIVNRINDAGLNFVAQATDAGNAITEAMHSTNTYIDKFTGNWTNISKHPSVDDDLIINNINKGGFITKSQLIAEPHTIDCLSKTNATIIENDKKQGTSDSPVKIIDYAINLETGLEQSLVGSSNGEWDETINRIPTEYQQDAHAQGLKLLRRLRIAGVFCMYGEDDIQLAYRYHGEDPNEPEKGMNNNETCKWRTILLGSPASDRSSKSDLALRASVLNNQYILLLGQGLIDTGFNGVASQVSASERITKYGVYNEHQLLPYECTQYVAGLRSKLSYDESIFGGQGRKRIRSVGDLEIAPLFDYEEEYEWDPNTYIYLNEAGVLTFTEEYGNITLTDGVTTCQKGFEEDEEGVMNILKYAQHSVYNVCLPYIGRNINSDLEQSITMDIQGVLDTMKESHQSIVDTDEYQAYTVNISLGSRANQLLGKIYVYLTITPAHALRQIEVEMTVQ